MRNKIRAAVKRLEHNIAVDEDGKPARKTAFNCQSTIETPKIPAHQVILMMLPVVNTANIGNDGGFEQNNIVF